MSERSLEHQMSDGKRLNGSLSWHVKISAYGEIVVLLKIAARFLSRVSAKIHLIAEVFP